MAGTERRHEPGSTPCRREHGMEAVTAVTSRGPEQADRGAESLTLTAPLDRRDQLKAVNYYQVLGSD